MSTKLRVENLSKRFGDEVAVDGMSFTLEEGKIKTLLGPSGCGKTTTLRCIAGLEHPDAGEIYIDNELVSSPERGVNVPPKQRDIGMVFQNFALWPHMTVRENISFPLDYRDYELKGSREERVDEILQIIDLVGHGDNLASNLSGGQQQRVALGRALITEPDLLLLDEPLSNLDAKLRREVRIEVQEICEKVNATMLYVTHSQDEALFLSDEIAIMNKGRIEEENDPVSIHDSPRTFFAMDFMGRSNILEGEVGADGADGLEIRTPIGVLSSRNLNGEFAEGDRVKVGFRPKTCKIVEDEAADGPTGNGFRGEITRKGLTQDMTEYQLSVDGNDILVRSADETGLQVGDTISVSIDPSLVSVFPGDARTVAAPEQAA